VVKIDFEELRRIHRQEKNSQQLAELSEDFLNELKDYLAEKKAEYLKNIEKGSTTSEDFLNIQRMAREILEIRERKILKKAFHAAMSPETEQEPLLSGEEKKLFSSIYKVVCEYKKYLDGIFVAEQKGKEKEKHLNTISVQIIEDVPAFVGANMKEFGPYKKDQLIELPQDVAEILISRKLAIKK